MDSKLVAVRLPESIDRRLARLAAKTHRTKTHYIKEAILEHLDELEELAQAEVISRQIQLGKMKTHSLEDVERMLGLGN